MSAELATSATWSLTCLTREPGLLRLARKVAGEADIAAATRAVARHLRIELSDAELATILPRLDVGYMKTHIARFEPKSVAWVEKGDGFQFVRKGEVGGGKALFRLVPGGPPALLVRTDTLNPRVPTVGKAPSWRPSRPSLATRHRLPTDKEKSVWLPWVC